jgi:hypothetical protein
MRRVLIDWLVDVHLNFKLLPETLFICINLTDRYIQLKQIPRKNYQLVGVTALFIASKYEEIYPPYMKDFRFITDNAYSIDQIKDMENLILHTLDFDVMIPTPIRYCERYAKLASLNEKCFHLSMYMLELALVEVNMNKWKPS